jgi:amino acid transporter
MTDDNKAEYADDMELQEEEEAARMANTPTKFGAWDGVMAGCLLNIFGVIMFLRVGFVVGQSGILLTLVIMSISTTVVTLTALSMSAICTNGTILAGGAYYIISRALGPAVGGAVGILFSLGNMVAISMYLIGFAETLYDNLWQESQFTLTGDPINDVRIWSNVVLIFVLILAIIGLKYVIKTQLVLLAFISIAILLFFVGSFYRTKSVGGEQVLYALQGWSNGNLSENIKPGFDGYDFWGVLAIFFPAVTGIMAGANISGDLKDPSSDIPKGTLTAIGVSSVVYAVLAVFVGAVTRRSELLENAIVMSDICVWNYIVLIGIYAATLSSAIASLVGAPRILQAVASDNIFPYIDYFAVGDKDGNPIRGYFLSFAVAVACNCIGQLNVIAPLISQFFMMTYLLINFACFFLEISHSPGWRPSFKYFNKYTSGIGAFLCLIIMFLLDYVFALLAGLIGGGIYIYVYYKDPDVNWGSAPQSRKFFKAYKSILKLRKTKALHIKNWRPGFLVLCRDPIKRPQMMLFAQTLKKSYGAIFYATVHTGDYRTNVRKFHEAHSLGYLPPNVPKNAKGFYDAILADSFRQGVQNLFQLCGLGSLRPNTLIIGFKRRWKTDSDKVVTEFVQILRDTLVMGNGLMMCCGFKRINWILEEFAPPALQHDLDDYPEMYSSWKPKAYNASSVNVFATDINEDINNEQDPRRAKSKKTPGHFMPRTQTEAQKAISMTQAWALGQQKDTFIDVWWLIDDGGLSMLVPYIMQLHPFWKKCKLRIIMVADEDDFSVDIGTMQSLISKFRLPYEGPIIVTAKREPHENTVKRFETLARLRLEECARPSVLARWLILSELVFEYSRYAGMNVVTLPIPTKALHPRAYMAILEMLSDQERLPPTIIMRGNGESTLTFYSE